MPRLVALALLACFVLPVACAEQLTPRAGGGTMGPDRGVAGLQFGMDDGLGIRYWNNETAGGGSAIILTTCYSTGSGALVYCERHHLAP